MKRSYVVCTPILLSALAAVAHDVPPVTRSISATNAPALSSNGCSGQFVYN